jgi:chromosome partitioning protein
MTSIISLISSKGGVGKTTTVMAVGAELRRRGFSILGLDADPERRLYRWGQVRNDEGFVIVDGINETNINATIASRAADFDYVFCDLAGFGSLTMLYAIGQSDLVLVPTLTSDMDLEATIKIFRLAKDASNQLRHAAPAIAFLNRTPAAINPRTLAHTRKELAAESIPILPCELIDRTLLVEQTYLGKGPSELDPGSKCAENVIALTDAVLEELGRIAGDPSIQRKETAA